VDEKLGIVTLDFIFYQRWIDPAMANAKARGFSRSDAEYETSCWMPLLEINNEMALDEMWGSDASWNLKDDAKGIMQYTQKYHGTISNRMDLRLFPFDLDVVEINVGPKFYSTAKIVLQVEEQEQSGVPIEVPSTLDEWRIENLPKCHVWNKIGRASTYQNVNYDFVICRRPGYYLWKVMFVEVLIAIWSWTVFFMPQDDIADRYSISLTLFLAAVAFMIVVNDKLPHVSYLTIIDKNLLLTFVMLFLSAFETWMVYCMKNHGDMPDAAILIDQHSRWLFPLTYTTLQIPFLSMWSSTMARSAKQKLKSRKNKASAMVKIANPVQAGPKPEV